MRAMSVCLATADAIGTLQAVRLEVHELSLRYQDLRIADRAQEARLLGSLAAHGQQSPVLVHASASGQRVLLDGYRRVRALQALAQDLVMAVELTVPTVDALVLAHRAAAERRLSALEDGWLLRELVEVEQQSQPELAVRLQRSVSWVSRRLSLVCVLPEVVQQRVRQGLLPAQAAMRYLVPLARANAEECAALAENLGARRTSVREVERIYRAWLSADEEGRRRIVSEPRLLLRVDEATQGSTPELLMALSALTRASNQARRQLTRATQLNPVELRRAWTQCEQAVNELGMTIERSLHA
jgi:ParB/RepB/Spo0J family partition protein